MSKYHLNVDGLLIDTFPADSAIDVVNQAAIRDNFALIDAVQFGGDEDNAFVEFPYGNVTRIYQAEKVTGSVNMTLVEPDGDV